MDFMLSGRKMRQFIILILSSMLLLLLAGCGAKQYEVTTKNGRVYTATGALQYDVDKKTYSFENQEGKEVILNKEDIEVIIEKD